MSTAPSAPPSASLDLDRAILDAISAGNLPIPPYPAVALQVQEIVGRQEFGLAEVSRVVGSDPSLAADVLRCANSAFYGRGETVTGLGPAIIRIGAREVTRIALSSALATHAHEVGALGPLKRSIWIESVASAVLCQELARARGLPAEEAFVCGLLHDFGKVVVTSCVESVLARHPGAAPRPLEAWAALVDRYHVDVGLSIAARWKLPELVKEVIALHHGGDPSAASAPGTIAVVRACDEVVALLTSRPQLAAPDLAEVKELGAAERAALAAVIEQVPDFVAAFEGAPQRPAATASMVTAPASVLAPGQRKVGFGVEATVDRRLRSFLAVAMASNGLVVTGPEGLPEHKLLDLSLQCKPSGFHIWATAKLCRPEGEGFRVELQPFALGGEPRTLWNQLFRNAQAA